MDKQRRLGPDFFLVGAPKCGTTALNAYLAEHPQIFMGRKEQHYFGSDLDEIWDHPGAGWPLSAEEYFGMFDGSEWATRRGEASVWYLWSRVAAQEIHHYNRDARIIAAVRNPVDMLPSLHSQYVYDEVENLTDLAKALEAEADRRAGRRIPPNNDPVYPWRLFYRDVARYYEQLQRYFSTFGRHRVHVVVFDDLATDPRATYERVLSFLGVDRAHVPDFSVINANKRIRSRWLQHLAWHVNDESTAIRRIGKRLIPVHAVRSAMLNHSIPAMERVNRAVRARPPMDPQFRLKLAEDFAEDIRRLGDLLGRNLDHWYSGVTAQAQHVDKYPVQSPETLRR